jgi:D-threo-aldose 1-dehydrogenase
MAELETRALGQTGLCSTILTIGGAPLGSMPSTFGYEVSEQAGIDTAGAALAGPVRALDTSAAYSAGESERRIGEALRRIGGLPVDYLLSTKISRDLESGDFSGEQMTRSIAGSLERLGVTAVPLVYLHDPENTTLNSAMAPGGPIDVLRSLKDSGVAKAIGVAGGDTEVIGSYVDTGLFDVVLTHNRWTLVNRAAEQLIKNAVERGMGVVNAAVFGGGILASGTSKSSRYGYRQAPEEVLNVIRQMEALAAEANIPLSVLALQFSTRDSRIASTVIGVSKPERIEQNVDAANLDVPDGIFDELDKLASSIPPGIGPS